MLENIRYATTRHDDQATNNEFGRTSLPAFRRFVALCIPSTIYMCLQTRVNLSNTQMLSLDCTLKGRRRLIHALRAGRHSRDRNARPLSTLAHTDGNSLSPAARIGALPCRPGRPASRRNVHWGAWAPARSRGFRANLVPILRSAARRACRFIGTCCRFRNQMTNPTTTPITMTVTMAMMSRD